MNVLKGDFMYLNFKKFVDLIKSKHVQVKLPLKKLSSEYQVFDIAVKAYQGEERYIWCDVEAINDGNLSLSYMVFCNPMNDSYKGKRYYTTDLLSLVNNGVIDLRIKYDKKYDDKIVLKI